VDVWITDYFVIQAFSKTFKHHICFQELSRALKNGDKIFQELSRTFNEEWPCPCQLQSHIEQTTIFIDFLETIQTENRTGVNLPPYQGCESNTG